MAKILLVDDDIEITELLTQLLEIEGFVIDVAYNGMQALEMLNDEYDIVLLDIMMPILNGTETLKLIRKRSNIPVLILSARSDGVDKVIALELGADDYLPKPFDTRELVARIKAILRRNNFNHPFDENLYKDRRDIYFSGLTLHSNNQQVFYNNVNLELTGTEYLLLQKLILSSGKILSREYLSKEILGKNITPFDRSIDMHISNLRKKLPQRKDGQPWFKTLRGRGYLIISDS